jgi:hypothetical protein
MRRLILPFSLCSILPLFGFSQGQWSAMEVGAMAGNMLNIYPNMPAHATQRAGFAAFRFGGRSPYRELYRYPEHGFIASFHDFGNTQQLGYGYGLQYQVSFNQYLSKRIRTFERLNIGGIYVTRPYHFIDNPGNNVFGTPFTALISASAGVRYKTARHAIALQASYWHSSNAHTALPNVGMNTPMLMLSIERFFYIEDVYVIDTTHKPMQLPSQWGMALRYGWGRNEAGGTVRPTNGGKYAKHLGSIAISRRYSTIHRATLSLEAYYDEAYALWNETMQWSRDRRTLGASVLMCMLGHEFIYGRFGLITQVGINIHNPTLDRLIGEVERPNAANILKRYIPGRFAMRYYLSKDEEAWNSPFIQIAVKSNMGQADFMEVGFGTLISRPQR